MALAVSIGEKEGRLLLIWEQLWDHLWRFLVIAGFFAGAVVVVRYIEWAIGERDRLW